MLGMSFPVRGTYTKALTALFTAAVLFLAALQITRAAADAGEDSFVQADVNKDACLSWEEFSTAFPSLRKEAFDLIDTNKDGRISREEWDAFKTRHGKQAPEGMGAGIPLPAGSSPIQQKPELPLLSAPKTGKAPHTITGSNGTKPAFGLPLLKPPQ